MRNWGRLIIFAYLSAPWTCFAENPALTASESESLFLERLMRAESNGKLDARNPLSSALGPYQFLRETFLDLIKLRFPELVSGKTEEEILALRVDPVISRNAALAYTRDNAAFLAAHAKPVTPGTLRLAFFVGPSAAIRVLEAKPEDLLTMSLSAAAIEANPALGTMTAAQLIAMAERESSGVGLVTVKALPQIPAKAGLKIAVQCNLKLPSCRKWLALAEKRELGKEAKLTRTATGHPRAAFLAPPKPKP